MGWDGHKLPNKNWLLFTRGGTVGVYIQRVNGLKTEGEEIAIPSELLRMLVAEDVRSVKQDTLDNMSDNAILGISEAKS
jgi:hypothetical protein